MSTNGECIAYSHTGTDPTQTHEWIKTLTGHDYTVSVEGPRRLFTCSCDFILGGDFGSVRLRNTLTTRITAKSSDDLVIAEVLTGTYRYRAGDREVRAKPGGLFLRPAGTGYHVQWEDITTTGIILSAPAVAAAVTDPEVPLTFSALHPVSAPAARRWRSLAKHVTEDVLTNRVVMRSSLVRASVLQLLAVTLVGTFPTRIDWHPRAHVVDDPPAVVRRAVAFIEEHAGEPLTVPDIARAARLSRRGLEAAFQRHLGTSPHQYLKRVRLDQAHKELMVGSPQKVTVREVAYRWGWASPSQFAAAYREQYQLLPSRTLHM